MSEKINILNRSSVLTRVDTYEIQHPVAGKVIYIEHINDKNKLTDCELRDSNGEAIDNASILEEIQEYVDAIPAGK
jgi:hypothetical protein